MIFPEIVPPREITTKTEKTFLVFSSVRLFLAAPSTAPTLIQHSRKTSNSFDHLAERGRSSPPHSAVIHPHSVSEHKCFVILRWTNCHFTEAASYSGVYASLVYGVCLSRRSIASKHQWRAANLQMSINICRRRQTSTASGQRHTLWSEVQGSTQPCFITADKFFTRPKEATRMPATKPTLLSYR